MMIRFIIKIMFCAALLLTGAGAGLCINVFMTRGVPVINGGGELLLLLTLPASVAVGFILGVKYITQRRRRENETVKHND